jgi:NTP pyrophosphatase (non-canonical NTP hydrolase)
MELNTELDRLRKYSVVDAELIRAQKIHPNYPADMFRQVAILNEEAGEVTKAVLQYHYDGGSLENIRTELIQTAAMCMRMLDGLKNEQPTKE